MYACYMDAILKDLENKGYEVLYLAAFGSYNYGLENENSDFDAKAIINVSEFDLVNNSHKHNLIKYSFGDCEILNIYEFGEKLKKFEIPYLEILFSDINYVNAGFDINILKDVANEILVKNRNKLGDILLLLMKKIYKTFGDSIIDFKGKKTYHVIRFYNLFVKFNSIKRYDKCLRVDVDKETMKIHKMEQILKENAIEDCEIYIDKMIFYMKHHKCVESPDLIKNIDITISNIIRLYKSYKIKSNLIIQSTNEYEILENKVDKQIITVNNFDIKEDIIHFKNLDSIHWTLKGFQFAVILYTIIFLMLIC